MIASQNCLNLIKKWEGCELKAYKCPAGVWTIGYGHTKFASQGMIITEETAEKFLRYDLQNSEQRVNSYSQIYKFNQNEFDALVSFDFNVGNGVRNLTKHGTRSREEMAEAWLKYNKANGKVLNGLTNRRKDELKLFLTK